MADQGVQRRLAAILAADVAGYTQLMEKDAEGTVAAWQAARSDVIRPIVHDHSGKLVKLTGDGFLIEFPTVLDAVTCAVSVQKDLASSTLDFRMGVHMGDIIDDGEDIHGEGVNVAARLEGLADAGGICVSGSVHEQVRNRIDVTYEDLGEKEVKNVSAPVRVYAIHLDSANKLAVIEAELTNKLSIAVLPFDNLSGDPEQEYFSDGMAEDLITDLSKISSLSVAARNSSFFFKDQMPDIREVGEKLDVNFVLEGSVRKMGDRLRINAQLIDAAGGNHLWAERYDGDLAEIFEFQDRIREEIVAALELKLTAAETTGVKKQRTGNIEAYDLYLKGRNLYHRFTPETYLQAIECLEKAIDLDPRFGDAYSYLSYCYFSAWTLQWPGANKDLSDALEMAETGVSLDPGSALAHTRLGWIQGFLRHYDEAIASFEKALSIEPDHPETLSYYGEFLNFYGEPDKGMKFCLEALRLEPFAPPTWELHVGMSYYGSRRFKEAATILKTVIDRVPSFAPVRLLLALSYAELNRIEEAREQLATLKEGTPNYQRFISEVWPYRDENIREQFFETLRKAGLKEEDALKYPDTRPLPADKPSIAVLPFDNMSGDSEQEYFSDGLSEDLITDLSKFSNLYVASRNSSFSFKDQMLDIKIIAEKLSVKFVLEGSVRKMGDKIRINAQLINALDGDHLWAERYDGIFEEVFDFQDRIREEIIAALKVQFNAGDQIKQNQSRNAEAYNFYLRGRADYYKYTPDNLAQAEDNLSQAIAIDPNMSEAHAYLSRCISGRFIQNWSGHDDNLDRAIEMAERAIALNENSSLGYTMLAWAQAFGRNVEQSKASFDKAIELDPNNSEAYATYALATPFFGDPIKALEILDRALEIDPLGHPNADMVRGQCYFFTNEYEEAERCLKRVIEDSPEFMPARLHLAANFIEMNKLDEATEEIQKVLKIAPDLTLDAAIRIYPFVKEDHKERFFGALQKAGLPEGRPSKFIPVTSTESTDKPSIAVLPFDNLSGDPEQEYFADGMTEDLITDLSKVSGLFVVARNSSSVFKGGANDVRKVAAELDVRYVLEGSVRKSGKRVRINAQLIDAQSGGHLWAERYDGIIESVFELQDEVCAKVVSALAVKLTESEKEILNVVHTHNLEAYELFVRAKGVPYPPIKEKHEEAIVLFRKVIEMDPEFAGGYAGVAAMLAARGIFGYTSELGLSAEAEELARKAIALDDSFGWSHSALGYSLLLQRRYDEALASVRNGVSRQPGDPETHGYHGLVLALSGFPAEGAESVEHAFQLNSQFINGPYLNQLGHFRDLAGDYAGAIKALEFNRNRGGPFGPPAICSLAAAYAATGEMGKAREFVEYLTTNYPDFTITGWNALALICSDELRDPYVGYMRQAGVPEG